MLSVATPIAASLNKLYKSSSLYRNILNDGFLACHIARAAGEPPVATTCVTSTATLYIGGMTNLYGHRYSKSTDQPGKVANPARGQLNRKK